ncbi:hypothetical protein [Stutzerimonas stutzeri]|nr:hypothetical protein [Stutzerimonas stutzeri]
MKNNLLSFAHDQSRRCRTTFYIRREHAMPYLTTLEFPTIDKQRYDALSATLASSGPPSGILFHSCAAVPHGWRITDLWESATASIGSSTYRSCPPPAHWAGQSRRAGNVSPRITQAWFSAE